MAPSLATPSRDLATVFVSRRRELEAARQVLLDGRLVTMTGPAGIGKSRLARKLASDVHRLLPDGAKLVELSALTDESLLVQAIAASLRVSDQAEMSTMDSLMAHVSGQHALLVLDGCDHLRESCAVLVRSLLSAAPQLRVLVTCDSALEVDNESVFPVLPLSAPSQDRTQWLGGTPHYGAVALFVTRLRAVSPGFLLNANNATVVGMICRRVEAVPLGIELCAAQTVSLAPQRTLRRLEHRLQAYMDMPHGSARTKAVTRAVIDWSHSMCALREQRLWIDLSVFAGSCDLAAAAAVCTADATSVDDVFALLNSLVNRGVVQRHRSGQRSAQIRYKLVDELRRWGRDRLPPSSARTSPQSRHLEHYSALADKAALALAGPEENQWIETLSHERDNLRAALQFSADTPRFAAEGLRLATALTSFWPFTATLSEGMHWLRRMLAHNAELSSARGSALTALAELAISVGSMTEASLALSEATQLGNRLGDVSVLTSATRVLALARARVGDLPGAMVLGRRALHELRETSSPSDMCNTLFHLSAHSALLRDAGTESLMREYLALTTDQQAVRTKGYALWVGALASWRNEAFDHATAHVREALALLRSSSDLVGSALCLKLMSWIAASSGSHERAAHLFGALRSGRLPQRVPHAEWLYYRRFDECAEQRVLASLGRDRHLAACRTGAEQGPWQQIRNILGDPSFVAAATTEPDSSRLTPREQQVASLIAHGLRNKEIASRLTIALRTVESHVQSIYTKLGVASRTQIASWITERAVS
ncbi:LuxR family transcriptional regulator [Kutzneria viridogrisea]|uniref:HTH luxR-type domain-containing protein n=1 Tax=Kutzneria albida DSM 43870 TaxID=1449976 RepID=W5W743_9PSEU|nr:hypothetical protein KALB_3624 [Kutzneria albida DSM 43870]